MVLIDGNSIGFAATASARSMRAGFMETGAIYSYLNRIRSFREQFPGEMIVLWDGRSWRYDFYADYKGTRSENPVQRELKAKWVTQRPYVAKLLHKIGVHQARADNMEADDLAGNWRNCFKSYSDTHTFMVTGDKDWLQCVAEDVSWIDPQKQRRANFSNFQEISDCENVYQFVQTKALTGDVGDNIKSVGGIGPKNAKWIMQRIGGVQRLFDIAYADELPSDTPKAIRDFANDDHKKSLYWRNLTLVRLGYGLEPAMENFSIIKSSVNKLAFRDLCDEYAFHSISRSVDNWLRPFI